MIANEPLMSAFTGIVGGYQPPHSIGMDRVSREIQRDLPLSYGREGLEQLFLTGKAYSNIVNTLLREPEVLIDRSYWQTGNESRIAEQYIVTSKVLSYLNDSLFVRMVDSAAQNYVPGYSRHSFSLVVSPKELAGYDDVQRYPGSDAVDGKPESLFGNKDTVTKFLNSMRSLEGIAMVHLNPDSLNKFDRAQTWYSGIDVPLPHEAWGDILRYHHASSPGHLANLLGMDSLGGRTKAMLRFSMLHPETWILKVNGDGKHYIIDNGRKLDIHLNNGFDYSDSNMFPKQSSKFPAKECLSPADNSSKEVDIAIEANGSQSPSKSRMEEQHLVAKRILSLLNDPLYVKMIDSAADRYVPGYSRHSFCVIVTPREPVAFDDVQRYPGSDSVDGYKLSVFGDDKYVSQVFRSMRGLEGVAMMHLNPDGPGRYNAPQTWYSGIDIDVPIGTWNNLLRYHGVSSTHELADKLGMESLGSRTKAMLKFSMLHPETWILKVDGKGGRHYILDAGNKLDVHVL